MFFSTDAPRTCGGASGRARDFSALTFVIVTVGMKKNIKRFNDILQSPRGTRRSPRGGIVSSGSNGGGFLTTSAHLLL